MKKIKLLAVIVSLVIAGGISFASVQNSEAVNDPDTCGEARYDDGAWCDPPGDNCVVVWPCEDDGNDGEG